MEGMITISEYQNCSLFSEELHMHVHMWSVILHCSVMFSFVTDYIVISLTSDL